jgi:hypothetical protein
MIVNAHVDNHACGFNVTMVIITSFCSSKIMIVGTT